MMASRNSSTSERGARTPGRHLPTLSRKRLVTICAYLATVQLNMHLLQWVKFDPTPTWPPKVTGRVWASCFQ